jgi:hypothetical protein
VSLCATSPGEPKAGCEYKRRRPEVTVLYDVVRDNVAMSAPHTMEVTLSTFHALLEALLVTSNRSDDTVSVLLSKCAP